MNSRILIFSAAALSLTVVGCENTEPSLGSLKVEMVAQPTSTRSNAGGRIAAEGDTVVFDTFMLGVTEITLKSKESKGESCDDDSDEDENHEGESNSGSDDSSTNKWKVEGAFVVDLINKTSTPDITAELPTDSATLYKMEIEFGPVLPDNNTLLVKATVKQNEQDYKVEFATNRKFEIHLKHKQGIRVSQAMDKLLVAFTVNNLFSSIDWSKAKTDSDGVIRLQNPTNAYLAAFAKNNFIAIMKWGHDKNHDHRLDDHDDD